MDPQPQLSGPRSARKPLREFRQNARDFDSFIFAELHEAIIQIDGFERLDENGLPRARSLREPRPARLADPRRARESRSGRFAA